MKQVDVICTGFLNSIIGPVQTIKRIRKNHDYFAESGYDVTIFTSDNISMPAITKIKNSHSEFVKTMKKVSHWLMNHSWIYSVYRVYHLFRSSHPLLKYYSSLKRKPDILVFHSLMDYYIYLKCYKLEGIKTACFTHSDGLLFKMLLLGLPKLQGGIIEKKLMKIADFCMSNVDVKPCIAQIEERNLLAAYPQLKGKTCLVVNAIDDLTDDEKSYAKKQRTAHSEFKYRMVSLGSVQRRKGQYTIVTAMNELNDEQLSNMHLTILGQGADCFIIQEYMERNPRLKKHIELAGAIKNTDVYKKLASANIMILMSENEGLPIALIEGLRSSLALISTRVSGIPELINEGANGVLLNPDKGELLELFNHFEKYDWDKMGEASRKLFEDYYTFERMRSDYLRMLNKVFGSN